MYNSNFYNYLVKDIMDPNPPLISQDADILEVAKRVCQKRRHVWVVDQKGSRKLLGIITEKDLLDVVMPISSKTYITAVINPIYLHHEDLHTAADLMSKPVRTCSIDTKLEEVLHLMKDCRIRRLAVIEEDEIIGELTLTKVIKSYFTITDD
jgi:CBS domain-containing protein